MVAQPDAVGGLVLGEDGRVLEPEGISAFEMTTDQQASLLNLVCEWAGIIKDETAEARMSEIQDGLNETYFAWSGPITNGEPIYYRITGPTLHIEFSHQAQPPPGDILHVHSIFRDQGVRRTAGCLTSRERAVIWRATSAA